MRENRMDAVVAWHTLGVRDLGLLRHAHHRGHRDDRVDRRASAAGKSEDGVFLACIDDAELEVGLFVGEEAAGGDAKRDEVFAGADRRARVRRGLWS